MNEATNAPVRRARPRRAAYRHFHPIQTRWHDNDAYGHVNNVVYYSYVDSAVNHLLVTGGLVDIAGSERVFIVVETGLTFFESVAYPEALEVGLAVSRLGRSSVTYDVAVFRAGDEEAAARGHFVHVYVERDSQRPVDISDNIRTVLQRLVVRHENIAG